MKIYYIDDNNKKERSKIASLEKDSETSKNFMQLKNPKIKWHFGIKDVPFPILFPLKSNLEIDIIKKHSALCNKLSPCEMNVDLYVDNKLIQKGFGVVRSLYGLQYDALRHIEIETNILGTNHGCGLSIIANKVQASLLLSDSESAIEQSKLVKELSLDELYNNF